MIPIGNYFDCRFNDMRSIVQNWGRGSRPIYAILRHSLSQAVERGNIIAKAVFGQLPSGRAHVSPR